MRVRCGEGRQDRFHSEGRDAFGDFAIQSAFPRQATHDSACPLQVTDRESSLVARLCTSRFQLSASLRPRPPPKRLRRREASSGERVRASKRRTSREDCHSWARPPFTCSPFLTLGSRFFGPSPPTDFCRPDSTYGHTLERRHPRPHRKQIPSRGVVVSCVCRVAVSCEAGHLRRAEWILEKAQTFVPPARPVTGTHPGRQGRVKGSRIA